MNNIDVSIIMPVYNSEKYLETAINSILNQDYNNFELLLIDDGSNDSSGMICDTYSAKDSRVIPVHKKNGGICSARNKGLEIARGEYIMFCDNDDIYLPKAISDNIKLAKEYNADIVKYSRVRVHVDNNKTKEQSYIYQYDFKVFEGQEVLSNYRYARNISSGVWCNMYKKSIIDENNISFPETFKYGFEDVYFNVMFYSYVNKVVLNPNIYYHWIQRESHSTSKKFNDIKLLDLQECLDKEYEYALSKNIINDYPGHFEDILTNYYVFEIYLCLLNKNAPYKMKEKVEKVKVYRNQPCFNNISKSSLKALKSVDLKRYLILLLFLKNFHWLNFKIIDFYSKNVSKIA